MAGAQIASGLPGGPEPEHPLRLLRHRVRDLTAMSDPRGPLTAADLMTLERYARERAAFRTRVLAHKRPRTVARRAEHDLVFEDRLTDPVPGAGDAAHRADLRARRASRRSSTPTTR